MVRKSLLWLIFAMVLACGPVGAFNITYTGDLVDKVPNTELCAYVYDGPQGLPMPVTFHATTLLGITRNPITIQTLLDGNGCISTTWPFDLYEMVVTSNGVESPPVALNIFSKCLRFGLGAGGALYLQPEDVLPTAPSPYYEPWRATFGLVYSLAKLPSMPILTSASVNGKPPAPKWFWINLPRGEREQLLYLDPLNPYGAVRVTALEFLNNQLLLCCEWVKLGRLPIYLPVIKIKAIKFYGYCQFEQGTEDPIYRRFELILRKECGPKEVNFNLRVIRFADDTVYEACENVRDGAIKFLF